MPFVYFLLKSLYFYAVMLRKLHKIMQSELLINHFSTLSQKWYGKPYMPKTPISTIRTFTMVV